MRISLTLVLTAFVVFSATSCRKEMENAGTIPENHHFSAVLGDNTRISIEDSGRCLWSVGDVIVVYNGNNDENVVISGGRFDSENIQVITVTGDMLSADNRVLDIETTLPAPRGGKWYMYASHTVASLYRINADAGIISGIITETSQSGVPFLAMASVGRNDSSQITFRHLVGWLKMKASSWYYKVEIRSNDDESSVIKCVNAGFTPSGINETLRSDRKVNLYTCKINDVGINKCFYAALVPMVLEKGLTFDLYSNNSTITRSVSSASSFQVQAGHVYSTGDLNLDHKAVDLISCTVKTTDGDFKCSIDNDERRIYARHVAHLDNILSVDFTFSKTGVSVPDAVRNYCEAGWPERCDLQFICEGKSVKYEMVFCDYVGGTDADLAPTGTWRLVWNDEFVAPGLDAAAWDRVTTPGQDNNQWNAFMGDAEDLVEVSDGCLVLLARTNPNPTAGTPLAYATGGVRGEYKVYRTIGRVDVKARMPKTVHGYWPAIWLMPGGSVGQTVERLKGGEIDILEYYEGYAYQTVHSEYNKDGTTNFMVETCKTKTKIDPGTYHIYSVEVTDSNLIFYIDGDKTLTVKNKNLAADKYQFPYHSVPHGIILSSQLGSANCHFTDNFTAVDGVGLPARMEIDFVRYYDEVSI